MVGGDVGAVVTPGVCPAGVPGWVLVLLPHAAKPAVAAAARASPTTIFRTVRPLSVIRLPPCVTPEARVTYEEYERRVPNGLRRGFACHVIHLAERPGDNSRPQDSGRPGRGFTSRFSDQVMGRRPRSRSGAGPRRRRSPSVGMFEDLGQRSILRDERQRKGVDLGRTMEIRPLHRRKVDFR